MTTVVPASCLSSREKQALRAHNPNSVSTCVERATIQASLQGLDESAMLLAKDYFVSYSRDDAVLWRCSNKAPN